MKIKKILTGGVGLLLFANNLYAVDDFSLHLNGKTVVCTNASVGDTGILNGITYTKIDNKK